MTSSERNDSIGGETASSECPRCHSKRVVKDGIRENKRIPDTQRYLCKKCGYRFSESSVLSRENDYTGSCQVCAFLTEAKNLSKVETRKDGLAGAAGKTKAKVEGKIAEFEWFLMKQGYKLSTIQRYTSEMEILSRRGANIFDPESVMETIAEQKWKDSRKLGVCHVYNAFLKVIDKTWTMPRYKPVYTHPFVPSRATLDQIVAGTGKKTSTFFQLLMETGVRGGEADALRWVDLDVVRRVIRVIPEKNSKPRTLKVSEGLIERLLLLPRKSGRVFGDTCYEARRTCWGHARKRLAEKLNNPQILKVTFHSVRHWYATTLYRETKNLLLVQRRLGHRSINSTLIYVEIEEELYGHSPDDKFSCEIAETTDKAKKLIEEGFEFVGEIHGEPMFRKRQ